MTSIGLLSPCSYLLLFGLKRLRLSFRQGGKEMQQPLLLRQLMAHVTFIARSIDGLPASI